MNMTAIILSLLLGVVLGIACSRYKYPFWMMVVGCFLGSIAINIGCRMLGTF